MQELEGCLWLGVVTGARKPGRGLDSGCRVPAELGVGGGGAEREDGMGGEGEGEITSLRDVCVIMSENVCQSECVLRSWGHSTWFGHCVPELAT